MLVFNGGRGAHLCRGCRTMVCEGIGADAPLDDAQTIHRLAAVVGKPCGRLFCKPKCAAEDSLSANEYAPAFARARIAAGNMLNERTAFPAVMHGAATGEPTAWFWVAWRYAELRQVFGKLAFCERLRDAADARDQVDAAARLGGYLAALPLLIEFERAAK